MRDEADDGRWVDYPLKRGEDAEFHLLDVRREELSPAEIGQRGELDLLRLVELDGDVKGGQGSEEGRAPVASVTSCGEKSVEEINADGDCLARQLKVVDDAVRPVANLLAPRRVQSDVL